MAIGIMAISLIVIIFGGIIAFFLLHHRKYMGLHRETGKFPGPATLPFIGNAHFFTGDSSSIFNSLHKMIDSYPSPFAFWLGNRRFFVVYEPETFKTIFLSPKTIEKEPLYRLARPWVGNGLFTASADIWRIHRKLIAPAFNMKVLESFVEIFARESEIMTKQMSKELGTGDFDIFEYVSLCTLDIICGTAMGITAHAQVEKDSRYVHSAKRAFEIIWKRAFNLLLHSDLIFSLTKLYRDQKECIKYLHEMTIDVIRERKKTSERIDSHLLEEKDEFSEKGSSSKKVFLDLLIELSNEGTKFTEEELEDEVHSMMIAGNDTTATVNTFVLFMLANNPEVQQKAYEELCEIYGDEISSDVPIRSQDLNRMIYLERVIKETLRLFPVAPILIRYIQEDLEMGDYTLPKGSSIVLGILKLHRWDKIWPDPLKFDPDRFLPDQVAKRHPYSFVPFSAGPRNCLGLKYAMMAMKVLLATVLRRYVLIKDEILKIEDIKLNSEVILKPVVPIRLRIEKR